MAEPNVIPDQPRWADGLPYFVRAGNDLVPTEIARGGWGPSLSGHVVGGLLAWAVEQAAPDAGLQPARLTVDLPRSTALEPLRVRTQVRHDRRWLRLVEAVISQNDAVVAQASALFLRRGPQPDGWVWSPPVQMPPLPLDQTYSTLFMRTYGWGSKVQNPDPHWSQTDGPKYTWIHETRPLIDDEPLSAFTRAGMAGDITAPIAN